MDDGNLPNDASNAVWLSSVLQELPSVPVTAALQARLLASFDSVSDKRHSGLGGMLQRLGQAIWPGAPAWQPAAVLAASLAIGIAAGNLLPLEEALADGVDQPAAGIALDSPPSFELGESSLR
jgi:hypothetical protein